MAERQRSSQIQQSSQKQRVSVEALHSLLTTKGEGDEWDFKLLIDLDSKVGRAELARDAMAFGNIRGGGTLVLGVSKSYEAIGIDPQAVLDTTVVRNAVERYIDGDFGVVAAVHDLTNDAGVGPKRFGLIYCWRASSHPLLAARESPLQANKTLLFRPGDIFVRRGAQSVRANSGDIRRMFASSAYSKEQVRASKKVWKLTQRQRKQTEKLEFLYEVLRVPEYPVAFTNSTFRSALDAFMLNLTPVESIARWQDEVNLLRPYLSEDLYRYYWAYAATVQRLVYMATRIISSGRLLPWDHNSDDVEDAYLIQLLGSVLTVEDLNNVRQKGMDSRPLRPVLDALQGLILQELRAILGTVP